jgi:hypothetical protein
VIAAVVVIGLAALLIAAAGDTTKRVAGVGVSPVYPVAPVPAGSEACQQPFGITEEFDHVRFNIGTFGKPGPALTVSVNDERTGVQLGWGRVTPGWVDNGSAQDVNVGTIPSGGRVSVCIRNEGPVKAFVYGDYYHGAFGKGPLGVTPTNSTNEGLVDGQVLEGDMAVELHRSSPRSILARLPVVFQHAAAFRPPIVGPWTFWLLAVLVLVGAPLALWAALSRAADATQAPEGPRYPDSPRP